MYALTLTTAVVTLPANPTAKDFGGFVFHVEAGGEFDADDYAAAYNLNRHEIDPDAIHAAQDAAAQLNPGEWLRVEHETVEL